MSITTENRIRVRYTFFRAVSGEFVTRCQSVIKGLTGNPAYPDLPISLTVFVKEVNLYTAALVDCLDGSRRAMVVRDNHYETLTRMLRLLGHYVELACNNDPNTFLSSGFEPLTVGRSAPEPLPPARIDRIGHGPSGTLLVWIAAVAKARSYQLRYGLAAEPVTGWLTIPVLRTRFAIVCNGLIPGTRYAFQVQSLGQLGYSAWSDSVTGYCS